ncbi:hypothetical protein L0U88_01575 [Flavihumibacter sp. RY-1]|uniref:Uncharacterized protein n=1 Tax=Flavihumibacter fluminis TaxID=2909236 RepID=A0ABS9BCR5_9BACT|nr:hypothetical protein [Flavihumibacter fluminis]MCF1713315.1 hypothetical protein [Flavihumibacter fluminis]
MTPDYLLISDSFDEGRNQKPWSGGNWDEYVKGKNEREWNERINNPDSKRKNSGSSFNPGNGEGCGQIILIVIALIIAIPAAISALFSSFLITFYKSKIKLTKAELSLETAFRGTFWTSCTYLITGLLFSFIFPNKNIWIETLSFNNAFKFLYIPETIKQGNLFSFLLFHVLCISISGIVFKKNFTHVLNSRNTYFHSLVIIFFIVLPTLLLATQFFVPFLIGNDQNNPYK